MVYLSVDVKTMQVIYYIKEGETKEDLLRRTEEFRIKEIDQLKELLKTYDIDIFKSSLNKYENAVYKVMTFDEFFVLQKKYYCNELPVEIKEEEYYSQMDVLPPILYSSINNIDMFCMSEFLTGTFTSQYARIKLSDKKYKYYTKIVDVTDKKTWIYNYI